MGCGYSLPDSVLNEIQEVKNNEKFKIINDNSKNNSNINKNKIHNNYITTTLN